LRRSTAIVRSRCSFFKTGLWLAITFLLRWKIANLVNIFQGSLCLTNKNGAFIPTAKPPA
jgi:hypothetical protein